jgi:hypothetical protein
LNGLRLVEKSHRLPETLLAASVSVSYAEKSLREVTAVVNGGVIHDATG